MEVNPEQVLPVHPEWVKITLPGLAPIDEFDSELEGSLARREKIVLVDPRHRIEHGKVRDGGFADTDDTDFIGLDQRDFDARVRQALGEGGRGHPAGGSPTD